MSWSIPVAAQHSAAPLTPEQLAAGSAPDPRPWLAARVALCRDCEHVARGGSTCAACDLRCAHPLASARPPLLAEPASTCPANLWSLSIP